MVDQIRLPGSANPQPTLNELWRDLAGRPSRRAAAMIAVSALVGILGTRWAGLPWVVTLVMVIVMAFGGEALLQGGSVADDGSRRGGCRFASVVARTLAAVAAVAIGLIALGMIFGDKIEVMRR